METNKKVEVLEEVLNRAITDLIILKDLKCANHETYDICENRHPKKDTWSSFCASYNAEYSILESIIDFLQIAYGETPKYLEEVLSLNGG